MRGLFKAAMPEHDESGQFLLPKSGKLLRSQVHIVQKENP
jgi:hypothetical protein